jgi:ATP adenylyltransferase/5',5'''-P-1,P-4-tetraphosphate phosphorylase II
MTAHQKKIDDAFADSNPDFDLGIIGTKHKLILNKYCVVRPQLVLHTTNFEAQSNPLDIADFDALWKVLCEMGREYFAIFNCGADAGASVGHKHMQILPHSTNSDFELFPDRMMEPKDASGRVLAMPGVSYQHAISGLPKHTDAEVLLHMYHRLASSLAHDLATPHNMILTDRWMMVIPRTRARIGIMAANAAAMVGMVWVTSEEQFEAWTAQDPMALLPSFGKSALTAE